LTTECDPPRGETPEAEIRGAAGPGLPGFLPWPGATDRAACRGGEALASRDATAKRVFDLTLGVVLAVAMFPVVVVAAVLIRVTSRGPVIYRQVRVGRNGRPFTMYKLRTMWHECERLSGPKWAAQDDPRVIPGGRFLRRTHVDELPQLWNVLRGEMSLVGPRPERPELVAELETVIPRYRDRERVRPGLTGLAQVQLPPDAEIDDVRRKLECDLFYVAHRGSWLDLRIVLATGLLMAGVPDRRSREWLRIPSPAAPRDGDAAFAGMSARGIGHLSGALNHPNP
jgi:lipopolysaccharide/colanic/teichoic acid biosynthesis glycosyltransferase